MEASSKFMVVVYRKICGVDVEASACDRNGHRRFEIHTDLTEDDAWSLFRSYRLSDQVLAIEVYDSLGRVYYRHDVLIDLLNRDANIDEYGKACWSKL